MRIGAPGLTVSGAMVCAEVGVKLEMRSKM